MTRECFILNSYRILGQPFSLFYSSKHKETVQFNRQCKVKNVIKYNFNHRNYNIRHTLQYT